MSDSEEPKAKQPRGALPAIVAGLFVLLPVLYVLSVGPFAWLVNRGIVDRESAIGVIYAPLGLLIEAVPVLENVFDAYLEWWE